MKSNYRELHQLAIDLCCKHCELEWQIIHVLQQIDKAKAYRHFGSASLFQYCVSLLGLTEATAYHFISVARKAVQVPALAEAIQSRRLSVSKAARMVSKLTSENVKELLAFAETHSTREVEKRINPERQVKLRVSARLLVKLKRAQAVISGSCGLEVVLEKMVDEYLQRHDPVEKAKRARSGTTKQKMRSEQDTENMSLGSRQDKVDRRTAFKRPQLKASVRNQVLHRDQGRCTHIDSRGKRCENERWLHIHHLKPRCEGGGDEMTNLTTLCAAHHDLVHQLSLPIDGQVTWLRSPDRGYGRTLNVYS